MSTIREVWIPQTQQDRAAVLSELQEILASPHFCNSKRYPALLRYVVETTLAGKSDLLKERTIGVEVFARPASYDTNTDTVVRYTAGEVRKRLLLYYHGHSSRSGVRISLPAGSYMPEFEHSLDMPDEAQEDVVLQTASIASVVPYPHVLEGVQESGHVSLSQSAEEPIRRIVPTATSRLRWLFPAALCLVAILALARWRSNNLHTQTALDDFWAPVLRDQKTALICTGGSSFAQNNFSGVITAGKDVDYPFVSMQIASAIAQLSVLAEHAGATAELHASASTPLTELRDHPVILLGGYNNQWSQRLLQPLRFHFSPEVTASIVDQSQPQFWQRDHSLPYSSADDFAIVARYRNTTTGSWVIVLAGLGRNGTEAAAQFVTSPHYLQVLHDRIGSDFGNRNVEVVLKVNVIEGKTGAPFIVATQVW